MKKDQIYDRLERSPVIAATDGGWRAAVVSDAEVLFHTGASLLTIEEELHLAKRAGKAVFVHIALPRASAATRPVCSGWPPAARTGSSARAHS